MRTPTPDLPTPTSQASLSVCTHRHWARQQGPRVGAGGGHIPTHRLLLLPTVMLTSSLAHLQESSKKTPWKLVFGFFKLTCVHDNVNLLPQEIGCLWTSSCGKCSIYIHPWVFSFLLYKRIKQPKFCESSQWVTELDGHSGDPMPGVFQPVWVCRRPCGGLKANSQHTPISKVFHTEADQETWAEEYKYAGSPTTSITQVLLESIKIYGGGKRRRNVQC